MMSKPPSPAASIGDNVTNLQMSPRNYKPTKRFVILWFRRKFVDSYTEREARGYALLLAVLILSTVLAGATALANIVISGIRQTREVSNAIIAYAAAESDVEQALYVLRKDKQDPLPDVNDSDGLTRAVQVTQPIIPYRIAENDFVSLPMPAGFTGDIKIPVWEAEQNCASWMEISFTTLDLATGIVTDTLRHARPLADAPLSIQPPANTVGLRLRALYCDISALTVNNLTIQSRVIIKSTAEVAGAKQAIEVTVPREAPASGLFDFVLFSEEDITKDVK